MLNKESHRLPRHRSIYKDTLCLDPMKKYFSMVNKVIDVSDIILEVVDARFVDETRDLALEKKVLDKDKKLIFVVNKVDLVDSYVARRKIKALKPRVEVSCKKRLGTGKLRDLIKRFAEGETYVGVVGYPNTGKSSIINALCGKTRAKVAPQSGHTKGYQFVKLTREIMLLDSPGVFPVKHEDVQVLASAIDFTKVKEPDYYVELLFDKFPGVLEKHYDIEDFEDFCEKRRFLRKGGAPDLVRAAKEILKDWQQGKIKV